MEFNKEGLFLLAKKLTNNNYSLPKNFSLKTNNMTSKSFLYNSYINDMNNLSTKDFIVNESHDNINHPSKKIIKFKNKFLEKENIRINEEKMMHLLSEKKRKTKLGISPRNNRIKKIIGKSKIIYINLDDSENNIINDISNTQNSSLRGDNHKYRKIIKKNTKIENNHTYNDNYIYDNIEPKNNILINSNSDLFHQNKLINNFIADRKSMKIIENRHKINITNSYTKDNPAYYKPKINNSRYDEYNNEQYNQIYFNNNNDSLNENNEEIYNDIKNSEKHINNNININININNNINNNNTNLNNIKKIDKKFKKFKKTLNKNLNQKKIISYRPKETSKTKEINNDDDDYLSLTKEHEEKDNNNNNSSVKLMKKYNVYYLKDIPKNSDNLEVINENKNKIDYHKYKEEINEKEKKYEDLERNTLNYNMDYNTYNINVNFISGDKNNIKNVGYLNDNNYKNINYTNVNNVNSETIISTRTKPMLSQPKEIIDINRNSSYFESKGNYNKVYSSKILDTNNQNINSIDENFNDTKLKSYSKFGKKYYKNKVLTNTIKKPNLDNTNSKYKKYNSNEITKNNILNNKKDIIQLEDLLILEGKFIHLLECLDLENPLPKMCVEWWNFYNYSSYFGKFPNLFPKTNKDKNNNNYFISDYQIAHDAILLELLSMIIIYKILCISHKSQNIINYLKKLMNEMHQNFLIECDYILSKVSSQSMKNIWIKKLKNLILNKKNWEDNNSKNYHLYLLKEGNNKIQKIIHYLINFYSKEITDNTDKLEYFNKNISEINLIELSAYFNGTIAQENIKTNKAFAYVIKRKSNFDNKYISIVVPYLPEEIENKKKFTLVLDLDETLISFRLDENLHSILKMRPGLSNFLTNVKKKYEIIAFTAGTQDYADPILDKIEKNGKIFAKRLYRQHTILKNNIYIKDLSRLGRDLSKIIIVDNMPQNFSLQKENGILIKNFFGQEKYETTLNDLSNILLKIASNPNNDVRKELKKFREEIFTKITTNLKC